MGFCSLVTLNAQTFDVDPSFNPSDQGKYHQHIGEYGVPLNSGKILTTDGIGWAYTKIYRLNNDGSKDNSFSELSLPYSIEGFFANPIQGNCITVDSDSNYQTTTLQSYNLINNSLIPSFSISVLKFDTSTSTYHAGGISKIVFLNNGKFLILGDFNLVNGITSNNIVRLNSNGSIDTSFYTGTGFNSNTTALAIQPDGKFVIGGNFTNYNNVPKARLVRLEANGLLDASFNVNAQNGSFGVINGYAAGDVNDIVIQPDGKIITSGPSLYMNSSAFRRDIVRLNSNGSVDASFIFNQNYTGMKVTKMSYNSDGSIFFGLGTSIKKCNNLGVLISTFNDKNELGSLNRVSNELMMLQNDKLIVVGDYKNALGLTRMGYHRLNADGSLDVTFNPNYGPNCFYSGILSYPSHGGIYHRVLPDNKILLCGGFTSYNDTPVKRIIRLHENGEIDTSFNLGLNDISLVVVGESSYKPVQTKKNYDGKVYVKGYFQSGKKILKLNYDGSVDPAFNFYHNVADFRIMDDNSIIAIVGNRIVKYKPDCTVDDTFISPIFDSTISSIELLDNNKIIVCGRYDLKKVVKLNENGSYDNTFEIPLNQYNLTAVTKTDFINDKIYVGGIATNSYPYSSQSYLTRYNIDGTFDNLFNPIQADRYFFLSNNRTITTNLNDRRTLKINDSNGNQLTSFSGIHDEVSLNVQVSTQNCENIILSGNFKKVNDLNLNSITRLTIPGSSVIPTPTGELHQLFTQGQTLADLIVNGENVQWYAAQNDCVFNASSRNADQMDNVLHMSTLLTNGTTYYASQIVNGVESNHRLPVTANTILGVDDFAFNSYFKLYPNPASSVLNISKNVGIELDSVIIYNTLGQSVKTISNAKTVDIIDISNLSAGIYFIKVNTNKGISNTKFIKN